MKNFKFHQNMSGMATAEVEFEDDSVLVGVYDPDGRMHFMVPIEMADDLYTYGVEPMVNILRQVKDLLEAKEDNAPEIADLSLKLAYGMILAKAAIMCEAEPERDYRMVVIAGGGIMLKMLAAALAAGCASRPIDTIVSDMKRMMGFDMSATMFPNLLLHPTDEADED